ncbi:MAG: glycine betaine ABC transporter substrate-binding protein [Candidatus Izemoplasmataceae bacterium]
MKKLMILLLLAPFFLITGCDSGEQKINLGMLKVPNDAMLAKQMGLFEEKFGDLGYDVEYIYNDSGVEANQALASGDLDFATMGNINALVALGTDVDTELIWIHETLGDVEALAVKNDSGIETVNDLKGEKIATTFASTAHYILLNVLKEAGIEDEVELLNMKTSQIVAAWDRGDIKAAYTWQPSLGELLDNGEVLVSSGDMIDEGFRTANVELARKSFAEEHPELVETYIECMHEAHEYFKNDREGAIEALAVELGLDEDAVATQVEGSVWTSLEDMRSSDFMETYRNTMQEQSVFLEDQDLLDSDISYERIRAFMNDAYAQGVDDEKTD